MILQFSYKRTTDPCDTPRVAYKIPIQIKPGYKTINKRESSKFEKIVNYLVRTKKIGSKYLWSMISSLFQLLTVLARIWFEFHGWRQFEW